tara:strand:- start:195 stop:1178 length:984 start_codon:yes stop_codon:yes gene_type:complete
MKIELLSINDFKIMYGLIGVDYARMDWLSAIDDSLKYDVSIIVQKFHDNNLIALPIFCGNMGPIKFCGAPLKGSFTGHYDLLTNLKDIKDEAKKIFIQDATKLLCSLGYQYIELPSFDLKISDSEASKKFIETNTNLVVDISDMDITWKTITGRARTAIRKATKLGVEISQPTAIDKNIAHDYKMIEDTFKGKGLVVPHPIELYLSICKLPYVKLFRALKDGVPQAFGLFGYFDTRCIYLAGGMTREGGRQNAPSLLQWHVMMDANKSGINLFDLGGIGDIKVDKFKSSFSNSEESHHVKIHSTFIWQLFYPLANYLRLKGLLKVNH